MGGGQSGQGWFVNDPQSEFEFGSGSGSERVGSERKGEERKEGLDRNRSWIWDGYRGEERKR